MRVAAEIAAMSTRGISGAPARAASGLTRYRRTHRSSRIDRDP